MTCGGYACEYAEPSRTRCPEAICDCFITDYPESPRALHPEAFVVGHPTSSMENMTYLLTGDPESYIAPNGKGRVVLVMTPEELNERLAKAWDEGDDHGFANAQGATATGNPYQPNNDG